VGQFADPTNRRLQTFSAECKFLASSGVGPKRVISAIKFRSAHDWAARNFSPSKASLYR
jgi:hypothetical protein